MNWVELRERFVVLDRYAYLNAGTNGPLAKETIHAIALLQAWEAVHGRAGKAYFDEMLERRERVRALVAEQLAVPTGNVALTDSTTRAVHAALAALGLGPGDEVVTTDSEHFGLLGPLAASGAKLEIVPIRDLAAVDVHDAIAARVTRRTRLLALSAVGWLDGKVIPWAALREQTGVPVLVDGAQSVGAIEVDATRADFYTVSAQKWLCGPEATGALYVREPEAYAPRLVAYPAAASIDLRTGEWEPKPGAARFDTGFAAPSSLAGLEVALTDLPSGRFERARVLAERCRVLLVDGGYDVVTEPGQATLVSFRAPGDPLALRLALYDRGVVIRDLPGTDLLRASVGWWNDEDDLLRLVEGLGR